VLTPADHELFALARTQDSVFSLADAAGAGLREPQIRVRAAHFWERIYDGVFRIPGAAASWKGELLAATLAGGPGAAISHRAAAALYGLPGGRDDLVELTCVRWKRTTHPGLVVHESRRLAACDIQLVDGIPVTTPERVILDIASYFPSANYLELVVQAARRKRLVTYASTQEMFDRHARRGLKGVRAVREVLERWDPESRPTESEMETLLVRTLRENGLPEPVVQFEISDAAGRFIARVDAAYPAARIAIEYDSKQEHSDEFQIARNDKRRNALQANRYWVLSARHRDLLTGGTELCDQITAIMRRKNSEPA
jgi:very-short-patch-repair endonuclease